MISRWRTHLIATGSLCGAAVDYVDDMLERRAEVRPQHLALLEEAKDRGELVNAEAPGDADSAILASHPDLKTRPEPSPRTTPTYAPD